MGCPFRMAALGFLSAFATLAVSFWPYMIPFSVTIAETASSFMFWGAGTSNLATAAAPAQLVARFPAVDILVNNLERERDSDPPPR
jgi:hypothetical protein